MNRTINHTSIEEKTIDRLEAVLVLSAASNHGKSSTLLHVAEDVFSHGKNSTFVNNIKNAINSLLSQKKKTQDRKFIIEYCGFYIYIATDGDSEEIVKNNINFFQNKIAPNDQFYMVDINGDLQPHKEVPLNIKPHICISACRTDTAKGYNLLEEFARKSWVENLVVFLKKKSEDKKLDTITKNAMIRLIDRLL